MKYELSLGLRYVWAKNSRHLLIAILAMLGIFISVAAVIFILSLLNGFGAQLRSSVLGYVPHATVSSYSPYTFRFAPVQEWRSANELAESHDDVIAAAPYVDGHGLARSRGNMSGVLVRGVMPEYEKNVSQMHDKVILGDLDTLQAGEFNAVIGVTLASKLGVRFTSVPPVKPEEFAIWQQDNLPYIQNLKIDLLIPQTTSTPAGIIPRMRRLNITGVVQFGMAEYDSSALIMHAQDASVFYKLQGGMTGLRLKLKNPDVTDDTKKSINDFLDQQSISEKYVIETWKDRHSNLFAAIELEKTAMFVVMCVVTLIASFSILSTMMILVSEKRADIAVMRTLGSSPKSILQLFLTTGVLIGLIGTLLGVIVGCLMAYFIPEIKTFVELLMGRPILDPNIYYISELSREIDWFAVAAISTVSMVLCIVFTFIPAIRASLTQPAEVLRYE